MTAEDRAAYSLDEIIARMNWIGAQPDAERTRLREDCLKRGYHNPTGERVMVNPPIDSCFHCGIEYRQHEK